MRYLFVNQVHPAEPHIGGQRAWQFACALARQGHQVLLVTAPKSETTTRIALAPDGVRDALRHHDWTVPFILPVPAEYQWGVVALRGGTPPPLIRRIGILAQYLLRGGMFDDWTRATRRYWGTIASEFAPQATVGIFGNYDAVRIARGIAAVSGVPWVLDLKDPWAVFIPAALRATLALRIRGAAAVTVNSEWQAEQAAPWFPRSTTVYSGVPVASLHLEGVTVPGRVAVIGSLYDRPALATLIEGVAAWASERPVGASATVELHYCGRDEDIFRSTVEAHAPHLRTVSHGYLPLDEMLQLCRNSQVVSYVGSSRTFHHKVLELFTCGRPVVAVPRDSDEVCRLAARAGVLFTRAARVDDVRLALCASQSAPARRAADREWMSWDRQADALQSVLADVVARNAA